MMMEVSGDLYICDPTLVKEIKPLVVFDSGIGNCFMTVHPVEEYKTYMSGREYYIKERLSEAYSGYMPRQIGKLGTDSGKLGVYLITDENLEYFKAKRKDCFKVRGFHGKVGRFYDSYGMLHIYTSGNYNFYTI